MQDAARDFPLSSLPVRDFVKSVASRTPAPGGGSVAAATSAMVSCSWLTGAAQDAI